MHEATLVNVLQRHDEVFKNKPCDGLLECTLALQEVYQFNAVDVLEGDEPWVFVSIGRYLKFSLSMCDNLDNVVMMQLLEWPDFVQEELLWRLAKEFEFSLVEQLERHILLQFLIVGFEDLGRQAVAYLAYDVKSILELIFY